MTFRRERQRGNRKVSETQQEFVPARLVKDGKVLRGRDGWLFLAGDTNDVLRQHTGELLLDAEQLDRWHHILEARRQAIAELGAPYLFVIAPDTHAIYDDKLPERVRTSYRRPVSQLRERLAEMESEVRTLYPLDALKLAKNARAVCSSFDTHWNDYGAFVVYEQIADAVESAIPMRRLREQEVIFFEVSGVGDLSFKLESELEQTVITSHIRHRSARLAQDNCIDAVGSVLTTECPDAHSRCLLVGDSYVWPMLKFLAESFRRFTFVQMTTLDLDFLERERPDIVISLMAERFLIHVPDDAGSASVLERARDKVSLERTRARTPFWDMEVGPSIDAVERMRALLLSEERANDALIVSLLAYAGLTPHELTSLRWRDIEDDHLTITPPAGHRGPAERIPVLGKLVQRLRGRPLPRARVVPLPRQLSTDFAQLRLHSNAGDDPMAFVVPGPTGNHWNPGEWLAWREHVYVPLATQCELPESFPFALNRTFAALHINAGASPAEVAAMCGIRKEQVERSYELLLFHAEMGPPVSVSDQIGFARSRAESLPPIRAVRADASRPPQILLDDPSRIHPTSSDRFRRVDGEAPGGPDATWAEHDGGARLAARQFRGTRQT